MGQSVSQMKRWLDQHETIKHGQGDNRQKKETLIGWDQNTGAWFISTCGFMSAFLLTTHAFNMGDTTQIHLFSLPSPKPSAGISATQGYCQTDRLNSSTKASWTIHVGVTIPVPLDIQWGWSNWPFSSGEHIHADSSPSVGLTSGEMKALWCDDMLMINLSWAAVSVTGWIKHN